MYVHKYVLLKNALKKCYNQYMRKLEDRDTRSLTKVAGHSFGLTLPIELIRKLGWRPRQKLRVTSKGKKLIVKDWKK